MKAKVILKKVLIFISALTVLISLVACGNKKPVEVPKDKTQSVEDKDMTKKIEKEKIVSGSKVYIKDKSIIATMLIEKGATKEQIDQVVKEYAQELKVKYKNLQEEYKGMTINVQAVQDGKNVANVIIEK